MNDHLSTNMEAQENQAPVESPIQSLPSDLLYEIFLAVHYNIFYETRDWAVAPWNKTAFLPRTFGLVCSAWYKVVVASPTLWASVVISHYMETRMIELSMQRSGGAPLRLYICTAELNSLTGLVRNDLRPYLHRCISIVHDDRKTNDGHLLLWSTCHKFLNSIIYLNLMKRRIQHTGMCIPELVRLPSLRRLDVNIRDMQQPEPRALALGLTTLHVQLDRLDILAIFKSLCSAQQLKTLAIYGEFNRSSLNFNSSKDVKPHLLPQLQSLSIFNVNNFLYFMGLIDAPRLQDVTLLQMDPSHLYPRESVHDPPCQVKSLSIPPFERLTVSVTLFTDAENWAPALFKRFPHVKDLTFGEIFGVLHLLQEMSKPPFDDKWPALQSVAVELGPHIHKIIDATCELIKSRSAAGIPLREVRSAHIEEILARFKNEDSVRRTVGSQVPIFRESTVYREAIRQCIYR